ncbi:MAG: 50S ribosomal protein L17 [Candidatus Magasanikbacteria bacterium]
MRHQMKKVTLDRKAAPRRALLCGLVSSLVLYEKITTTKAKAKAIKPLIEKAITKAKKNDLANRRALLAQLHAKNVVSKLIEVLGPRYTTRQGGYTRIVNLGNRKGDGAQEVVIEFV